MKYYNLGWNISNVVKFVHELLCQVKLSILLIDV